MMTARSGQAVVWAVGALLVCSAGVRADAVLAPGDFILAIDQDSPYSASSYPTVRPEGPASAIDNTTETKYLNYAKENSGIIITLTAGATVRSFVISTANDYEARDPASYQLYGTNDTIVSGDNSLGTGENWTLLASGPLSLPADRKTAGPVVGISNETAYTSYKFIFPTLKDTNNANSMQLSEISLYETSDGTDVDVTDAGGTVLAVDADMATWGQYPATDVPAQAIDGDSITKYVNLGEVNSGFIVTPVVGLTVVTSFQITTADNAPERDPVGWALYGATAPVVSGDNSRGDQETWTLIASGDVTLPGDLANPTLGRQTAGPVVSFTNTAAYNSYRMLFTSVRDAATADAMQIGDIQFYGTILSSLPDVLLSPTDPIIAVNVQHSVSDYRPYDQSPVKLLDTNLDSKYLNFGKAGSGLIVTPAAGSTVIQSMVITTANDHVERDPASYEIYGANAPIISQDNSLGDGESWTLIAAGDPALVAARKTAVTVALGNNAAAYKSYKLVFPTLKNAPSTANSMQIGGLELRNDAGVNMLGAGDVLLAINTNSRTASSSTHGGSEGADRAVDRAVGTTSAPNKYCNTGNRVSSGFIVTPAVGPSVVKSFRITTASDYAVRDPVKWALYGTDQDITSSDNGFGDAEQWTPIASGAMTGSMALPDARLSTGPLISFDNTKDYRSYRMVFPTIKYVVGSTTDATAMQIAEIQFYGSIGLACHTPFADVDGDHDVDQEDFGVFQACFTGAYGFTTDHTCRCLDRDKNTNVDGMDLIQFTNCVTGPSITWTQELRPGCAP